MKFSFKGWCNSSKVRTDGKAPVYIRIRQGKNAAKAIPLHKHLEPEYFDNSTGYPLKTYRTASHIKRVIDNKLMELEDVINDFERGGRSLSLDTLVDLVSGHGENFYQFAEHHLALEKDLLSERSYENHLHFLRSVKKFAPVLKISDITTQWLNDYKFYLITVKKRAPNGAAHEFTTIGKFVNIALKQGIINTNPFLNFKKPKETTHKEFLMPEELDQLYVLWKSGKLTPRLGSIAWYFLLSCYTSFRMKDVRELSLKMQADPKVMSEIFRSGAITINTSKSSYKKTTSIPVEHMIELLQTPPDRPLKQSVSRVNEDVRTVLKMIGVDRHLTYHSSRHTFGVVSKILGMDTDVLREIMTHSDIKTTQIYAKITDRLKNDQMKLWAKRIPLLANTQNVV